MSSAESSEAGLATILLPPSSARSLLFVSLAGYATGTVPLPPERDERPLEVRLARGATIEGVVVDARGRPVPSVDVLATDVIETPATIRATDANVEPSRLHALSDVGGRFRIQGLRHGHRYDINVTTDGWSTPPVPFMELRSSSLRGVPGGTENLRVEVVRVAAWRIRCIDAISLVPITAPSFVHPYTSGQDGPRAWAESGFRFAPIGDGTQTLRSATQVYVEFSSGICDGFVMLDAQSPEDFVRLAVDVLGYERATLQAKLLRPSDLTSAPPKDVRLVPKIPHRRGSLRIRETPRETDCLKAKGRLTTSVRWSGEAEFRWAATSGSDWVVSDLPYGRLHLTVTDGIGWSKPVEVEINAENNGEVRVEYPAVSGITIELASATGARLYEADVVIPLSQTGRKSGAVNAAKYTGFFLNAAGAPARVFCSLVPDTYVLRVEKGDLEGRSAPFVVKEGTVQTVRVTLSATDPK